eukprot:514261-Heterocapsa_arctica.AAC.1
MQTATAIVDRIRRWAESSCVQDAWRAAVEAHDIHKLWTLVSGGPYRFGIAAFKKRAPTTTTNRLSPCNNELREQ